MIYLIGKDTMYMQLYIAGIMVFIVFIYNSHPQEGFCENKRIKQEGMKKVNKVQQDKIK